MNIDNDSISPEPVYDVLIVGAGPVGLAAAIGLRKRGINNILVIDRTREFRRVGQIVDLLPNGLKAIKYIDSEAYQQVKETAAKLLPPPTGNRSSSNPNEANEKPAPPKRIWHYKNLQGEITRSVPLDFETWFDLYGEGRVSLSWYDLQTTLRSLLPPEIVRANHRCIHVEEETAWVRIDSSSEAASSTNPFAHWEMLPANSDTPPPAEESQESYNQEFRAKLVVAADGINSTIRQVLYAKPDLRSWAKPQYSGWAAIGCLQIDNVPNSTLEELDLKYFQGEQLITVQDDSVKFDRSDLAGARLMLVRRPDNTMGYLLHAPLSLDSLQNKLPDEIIGLGIEVLKNADFPPIISELITLSRPEKLIYRPYYIHPADIPVNSRSLWSRGRVVLVGDAAHGMPPFIAQGANQGLEDAALIATLITNIVRENGLDDKNAIANAFNKYEQIRRPFMEKIQAATMNNDRWSQQQWDDYSEMVYRRNYPSAATLG